MKKFITIIGLCVAMSTQAQNFVSQSFLSGGISSVTLSNLVNPTNLVSVTSLGTNVAGLTYTNMGSQVTVTNGYVNNGTTNSWGGGINVFSDVTLWTDREGRTYPQGATNQNFYPSPIKMLIKTIANSGANSALTFTVTPVYDGVNESTGIGDSFVWSFTPTASATQVTTTNIPVWQWSGCKALRLVRVTNVDTDASADVALVEAKIVGFKP